MVYPARRRGYKIGIIKNYVFSCSVRDRVGGDI